MVLGDVLFAIDVLFQVEQSFAFDRCWSPSITSVFFVTPLLICPDHKEGLSIYLKIIGDVREVFPSSVQHLGVVYMA